ncbi:hypothetical protein PV02_01400 [Methanolobus chelungpuianus]|uniref:DUF7343 domain-containing protein n=2 Tax=Methanolobus chelungpuianus TaxID=502115 RepID=A0AAE3H912_9EURY|nr:hypothetical protein [Methanolobus chelungpuianus]
MASGIATVHGVAYEWSTFEPLDNAVIEVNTTPVQSLVAKSGVYSFDLSNGTYLVKATYYQNGTLTHYGEEVITVSGEGNYVVDLLLLPSYTASQLDSTESSPERTGLNVSGSSAGDNSAILIGVSLTLVLVLLILFYQVRYKREASSAVSPRRTEHSADDPVVPVSPALEPAISGSSSFSPEPSGEKFPGPTREVPSGITFTEPEESPGLHKYHEHPTEEDVADDNYPETGVISGTTVQEAEKHTERVSGPVPADLQEILDILVSQGGRMTQKDMRKRLRYSEGKVSLMLLDLEKRGKIQKFKKGRGNIIFLVGEEK